MSEIRYCISYRRYETLDPSLVVNIYAADGEGTILSNDPHPKFSHLSYSVPEMEMSEYDLKQTEASLKERLLRYTTKNMQGIRQCEYKPKHPVTREQIIDLFCRGDAHPISAVTIEAIIGIPTITTLWFNHDGYVPACDVLRELRQRLIPTSDKEE